MTEPKPERQEGWAQLDTLRLVLALVVVIAHANVLFMTPYSEAMFEGLHLAAWVAVQCFFVLSGLVIGRALILKRDGFIAFMFRRVGRIYPPLIASFALVFALDLLLTAFGVDKSPINAGRNIYGMTYDAKMALLHLATFGFRGWISSEANLALWSLSYEMRCYVIAGLAFNVFTAADARVKVTSFFALACALGIVTWQARVGFNLSYLSFAIGVALSFLLGRRDLPRLIPAVPVDISYSLYILHCPIMLAVCLAFYRPLPSAYEATGLAAASIAMSIAAAYASARFVEPHKGAALHKSLAVRLRRWRERGIPASNAI